MSEVTIKGVRQGILLILPDSGEWDAVVEQLETKLAAAASLIQGAKTQLDVGERAVSSERLEALVKRLVAGFSLEPIALIGTHEESRASAAAAGLAVTVASPPTLLEKPVVPVAPPVDPLAVPNNALYLRQTLRSGQSIRHDGTIVICGDVNPGAEVIATGDIIVFGTLRGVAHAGAAGDEDCQIIAINLRPTQIRIASYIARSPDTVAPPPSKHPEAARVQSAEIHIIPLRDM